MLIIIEISKLSVNIQTWTDAELAAAEGVFSYHIVKDSFSLRSKIIKKVFGPSFVKYTDKNTSNYWECSWNIGRGRIEGRVRKSIIHFRYSQTLQNHKNIKLILLLVKYLNCQNGIQMKLLEIKDHRCETAEVYPTNLNFQI